MNKFIVKYPLITEKAHDLSALGKYVFLVDNKANATEVKKVLKNIYKVDIVKVNVINAKPKPRRLGRSIGVKAGYKKVIITLKEGQKLDILPH